MERGKTFLLRLMSALHWGKTDPFCIKPGLTDSEQQQQQMQLEHWFI